MTLKRSSRIRAVTAAVLLVGAAVLSSGFVHRSLQRRRSRHQRQSRALEHEAVQERFAQRTRTWRDLRQRRRTRGGGWDRGRSIELLSQHYTFEASGQQTIRRLSATLIHRVMRRHNSAIGRCLMKHGASSVTIGLQIVGSGRVTIVTTDLAGVAARCVKAVVMKVRFPALKGPKTTKTTGTYRLKMH